uniref:G-protein coupled receptors family 1 profile domain-containing protein n=1 Tax=Romanomermis culicivorax TaxID=13658 RepID=A0A915L1U0_ROMCU
MLVSASSNPASIMGLLSGKTSTEGSRIVCTFTAVVCVPSCVASLYTMVGIAVSRYYYIAKYSFYIEYFTKSCVTIYILFIWCLAFMVHLPNHLGWGQVHYSTVLHYCTADTELLSYLLFYAMVLFTSIVFSFVYYTKLYLVLRQTTLARKMIVRGKSPINVSMNSLKHETMMIKTTFKMFLFFFVCWAPLSILFFARFAYLSPLWVYLLAEINEDFDKSLKKLFRVFVRRNTAVSVITPTNAKTTFH